MDANHDGQYCCPVACANRRQQRSDPDLQVNEMLPGSTDKASLGKVSSPDLLSAALGIADEQNLQRTSHTFKPAPKSSVHNTGASLAKSHFSIGVRCHFYPIF